MVAAGLGGAGFAAAASVELALTVVDFEAALMVAGSAAILTGVASAAVGFVMADFAVIGSGIAGSMTSFSSVILETRSFTIRIHITGTILTITTHTGTDTSHSINPLIEAVLDIQTL